MKINATESVHTITDSGEAKRVTVAIIPTLPTRTFLFF